MKFTNSDEIKNTNETTPGKDRSGIILFHKDKDNVVPDPSLAGENFASYFSYKNRGCKVINFGDMILLASSNSKHVITKHKRLCDVNGRDLEQKCPIGKCKTKFVHGTTTLAPMIVVGPVSHGNLGKEIWVCSGHWDTSVSGSDDENLFKETLLAEASDFEGQAMNPNAKKKLDFSNDKQNVVPDSIDDIFGNSQEDDIILEDSQRL